VPVSLFTTTVNSQGDKGRYVLYGVDIWESDVLMCDMIPVKRVADNVVGLYDRVNEVFYTNSGTGSFISGDEYNVNTPIVSTYIKTGGVWLKAEDCSWSNINI
jgi:hypothetical protein